MKLDEQDETISLTESILRKRNARLVQRLELMEESAETAIEILEAMTVSGVSQVISHAAVLQLLKRVLKR